MNWISFIFLFACRQEKLSSAADCEKLAAGSTRDDCWSLHIVSLMQQNEKKGMEVIQTQIDNSQIRDFIWLKVTREYNPATRKYCQRMQDEVLKKRCISLVSRPHLHRDVLRK